MTLNTGININTSLSHEDLFDLQLRAILTAGDVLDRYDGALVQKEKAGEPRPYGGNATDDRIGTAIGQGLPAITACSRAAEGELFTYRTVYGEFDGSWYEDEDELREAQEQDAEEASAYPEAQYRLYYDTAYGYTGPDGISCSTLHARAIAFILAGLPEGSTLHWQNEFTGEWFEGLDGLTDFSEDGEDAKDWYTNTVVPAIVASMDAHPAGRDL